MTSSKSGGWEPPIRRNAGRDNYRDLTDRQLRNFMKQSLRDSERELLRQPFRPAKERRATSMIPNIPRREMNKLANRAIKLAFRIAVRPIPTVLFKELVKWLFQWFVEWFWNKLTQRGNNTGWQLVANCAGPWPDPVGPDRFESSSLYPPSSTAIAQTQACTPGQAGMQSMVTSLQMLSKNARTAFRYRHYSLLPISRGQVVELYGRPGGYLPSIWVYPDPERENPPYKPLPPKLQDRVIPDWYQAVEPDRPKEEKEEPDRPDDPEREPGSEQERGPSKEVRWNPSTQTSTQLIQYYRKRTNTRTGEKEKKFAGSSDTVRQLFGYLARNKERLSELDDFLDVLIDSLPKEVKAKLPKRNGRATPDTKLRHIWDNFDKIDWEKFAEAWVKNWIKDKLVGKAIDYSDRSAKARGETSTVGTRGSWLHNASGGQVKVR